jgi:hypothetical protein
MTFALRACVVSAKTASKVAAKKYDIKSSLIFDEFGELLKTYSNKEFVEFSTTHLDEPFRDEWTTKENFHFLFNKLRLELEKQDGDKYVGMKNLLADITRAEEENILDTYIFVLTSLRKEDLILG